MTLALIGRENEFVFLIRTENHQFSEADFIMRSCGEGKELLD